MDMRYIGSFSVVLIACLSFVSCEKQGNVKVEETVYYETLQSRSEKRGVSFDFGRFPEEDCSALGAAVSWSYDWSNELPSQLTEEQFGIYDMEFIQMVWNGNYNPDNLRNYKRLHPEAEYILAFNEPNLVDQANMTPAEAAALWPDLKALADELGMKLISPAMNYGTLEGYSDPYKWLDEFFAQPGVSLDDVHGIAIHCYMGSVSALKNYVDGFRKYGKPIWLTEFCNWDNGNVSLQTQMKFMVEAINYLESDDDVARYAWFIPRGKGESECHNSLLTSRLPLELTDLGKVFVNMSTQDNTVYYGAGQPIPAEHYSSCSGAIHLSPVTDISGILELYDLGQNCSVDYMVDLPESRSYRLEVRYSALRDGAFILSSDGEDVARCELPATSKQWTTASFDVVLSAGRHKITISGDAPVSPNYNWFMLK